MVSQETVRHNTLCFHYNTQNTQPSSPRGVQYWLYEYNICGLWVPITLTPWGRYEMAAIFQTTFANAFFNDNVSTSIKISLKFVPIYNIPALVQIMAWWCPGTKPLSEPMMVSLLTHICVTRPQWIKIDAIHRTPIIVPRLDKSVYRVV